MPTYVLVHKHRMMKTIIESIVHGSPLVSSKGSVGAYSPSPGLSIVRARVADYLEARDGVPASPDDVYLGSGASDVIKAVLTMLVEDVDGKPPGMLLKTKSNILYSN